MIVNELELCNEDQAIGWKYGKVRRGGRKCKRIDIAGNSKLKMPEDAPS
jgi:hypothetical protein